MHDLADAILIFFIVAFAFGIAHFLNDDLLCGLCRDARKFDGRKRLGDDIACLRCGIADARIDNGNFRL